MILHDILIYSVSSAVWGLLLAAACTALLVLMTKGWHKDTALSLIGYDITGGLFLLLAFQFVLMVGSLRIISMTDVPLAIADELRPVIWWYVLRRVLWSLGFMAVAAVCMIKTMPDTSTHTIRSQRLRPTRKRVGRRTRR